MQISSALSSYANAAFDTARSAMKGLADAAAPRQGADHAAKVDGTPAKARPEPVRTEPVRTEPVRAEAAEAPAPIQGQRQGVTLDAYA